MNEIVSLSKDDFLGPSFEWLDVPLQMDLRLHAFYGSVKYFKIELKGFFFFFSFFPIFLWRFGHSSSYSLVQSQSMSPFSLPKWLLSDEAFHPWGSLKYRWCSCCWLWVKIWAWSTKIPSREHRQGKFRLWVTSEVLSSLPFNTHADF